MLYQFGLIIDLFGRKLFLGKEHIYDANSDKIGEICEHDHCNCEEEGILKSSIKHTLNILQNLILM